MGFYKHPTYGHVYGESVPTPVGRVCWAYLTKPKDAPPPQDGKPQGEPRYEATLLLDKTASADFVAGLKKMTDEMLVLFNKGRSANLGECLQFGKYGDGDTADMEKYPYYKNCWVVCARNAKVPKVVGKDRKPVEPGTIHGGMKAKFVITPLITAHGISYKLEAVQWVEDDGTRFGGAARDAVELFDACEEEAVAAVNVAAVTEAPTPEGVVAVAPPAKTGKDAALDLL